MIISKTNIYNGRSFSRVDIGNSVMDKWILSSLIKHYSADFTALSYTHCTDSPHETFIPNHWCEWLLLYFDYNSIEVCSQLQLAKRRCPDWPPFQQQPPISWPNSCVICHQYVATFILQGMRMTRLLEVQCSKYCLVCLSCHKVQWTLWIDVSVT